MSEWLHVEIIEPGKAEIWYGDGDLCAVDLGLDVDAAGLAALFASAPGLLAALKAWEEAEAMWEKIRTWEYKTTVRPNDWDALYDVMFAQYTKAKELRQLAIAKAESHAE